MKSIMPIIKWTGSKRYLAPTFELPEYKHVIEPFVGAGAMLPYYKTEVLAGDIIPELIGIWLFIKNNPAELFEYYASKWAEFKSKGKQVYFDTRTEFNTTRDPLALFFLSRTSANGLIRFNRKGEFNASVGYGRNGIQPHNLKPILNKWHEIVKKVTFVHADYRQTLISEGPDTFIFLDPPYANSDAMYLADKFDYAEFWNVVRGLRGKWLLTVKGNTKVPDIGVSRAVILGGKSLFRQVSAGQASDLVIKGW
jgi:DNA adenine methylase